LWCHLQNRQQFQLKETLELEDFREIEKQGRFASSDVEAEADADAPEAVVFWWKRKRKRLKICHFRFHSVSKLPPKFWQISAN
jgi:hypothetical protein